MSAGITRAKEGGGIFAILDVSKAFDTVSHEAIRCALLQKGLPQAIVGYIAETYKRCRTTIKTEDGEIDIELNRGVKQGDPLSPLLFNLVVEPIIDAVQNQTMGIEVEGQNLAAMVFADDIILLAHDRQTAVNQFTLVCNELKKRGMVLSIDKSSTFQYIPRGRTWYVKDPELIIKDTPIPYSEPDRLQIFGCFCHPLEGPFRGI